MGSFFAPETDMIFWRRSLGPPLFEALIANSMLVLCDVDVFSTLEQGS